MAMMQQTDLRGRQDARGGRPGMQPPGLDSYLRALSTQVIPILGPKVSLGLQIAQSRPYLYTLGPKVGIICIHGALGYENRTYFWLFGALGRLEALVTGLF